MGGEGADLKSRGDEFIGTLFPGRGEGLDELGGRGARVQANIGDEVAGFKDGEHWGTLGGREPEGRLGSDEDGTDGPTDGLSVDALKF